MHVVRKVLTYVMNILPTLPVVHPRARHHCPRGISALNEVSQQTARVSLGIRSATAQVPLHSTKPSHGPLPESLRKSWQRPVRRP